MLNRLPLAALVLVIAALTAAPALGATGPVGIWTLDEGSGTTVTDGSGNGNNGVLSGGTTWVPGISGSAVGFDGFSGQIKVEDNDALEPAGAITVSAWVKHAGSPGTYRYIVAKGGNGCIAASYGLYSGPSGGLQFYVSQHHGSVYARSPDAGQGIWDGNWHLAVGTYDGTTIRLYVDGVEVGSGTAWTGALEYLLPSSNDFYIGNYPSCQDHWFAGAIDDVMVWGRALSASEISAMVPGSSNPTGPNPPSTPGAGGGQNGGGGQDGSGGTGSGSGTRTAPKNKDLLPSIRGLELSTSTVTLNTQGHVVLAPKTGLSITYTESQAAKLTVTLLRSASGVRRGGRCVTPTAKTRRLKHCTRFVVLSSFIRTDRAGRLTLRLDQLLHGRLSPGTYRLDVTPRANGKVGKTVSVRFVVRRSRHR
ncbi:MAG: LamG domain-containing protein [Solirubrobacteraceae bacterium]